MQDEIVPMKMQYTEIVPPLTSLEKSAFKLGANKTLQVLNSRLKLGMKTTDFIQLISETSDEIIALD